MSHKVAKDAVVNLLEGRYDYQSARNVLTLALNKAGVEDKGEFSSQEIDSVCNEIEVFATHVSELLEKLHALGKGSTAAKPAAEKKAPPKAQDKKAGDAKADDKKDAKADDKKDAKADAKPAKKTTTKKAPAKK